MNTFEVLADHTRRQVVEALQRGEQPVNDIVAATDIHQSGVSRHLRILLEAGFVRVRPEGQLRLYSLRPEPFQEMEQWLGRFRDLWAARLDRFEAAWDAKRGSPHKRSRTNSRRKQT